MVRMKSPVSVGLMTLFAGYCVLAYMTDAKDLLAVGNVTMTAMSVALMVTYAPNAWASLHPNPARADILGLGIFLGWCGNSIYRVLIALRYMLNDETYAGTDVSTFALFLLFVSGLCHMIAPDMVDRTLKRRAWVTAGLWTGFSTGILLTLLLLRRSM